MEKVNLFPFGAGCAVVHMFIRRRDQLLEEAKIASTCLNYVVKMPSPHIAAITAAEITSNMKTLAKIFPFMKKWLLSFCVFL